jgi:3',5'-cyclic AMP phosphodiesterase CpdA
MRFAIMADAHFNTPERGRKDYAQWGEEIWWNRLLRLHMTEIGEALVATFSTLKPDFIIHCGDLTEGGDAESFELARGLIRRLPCPFYFVNGNHDQGDFTTAFYDLPAGRRSYSRTLGGLHFIFLDTNGFQYADGSCSPFYDDKLSGARYVVSPADIQWLRDELTRHPEPVVVVSHLSLGFKKAYPAANYPDGRPLLRPPEDDLRDGLFPRMLSNYREIRALLGRHPHVKLALSGHWHINDLHVEDGVAFCQTCAMNEYPVEFRLAEVKDGVVRVTTHGLKNPEFSRRSLITERTRSRGVTIEPRGNAWVAGTERDRAFSVKL